MTYIYVALGGAFGALMRYSLMLSIAFPIGTLVINVLGSFLMGIAYVWFSSRLTGQWALFFMTGILGGFTTLSAFSLDVVRFFEAEKYLHAGSYILASIIFSLMAIFVGMFLMRVIIT